MRNDTLQIFNKKLADSIQIKNDEELWEFLLENEKTIKNFFDTENYPQTSALFAYPHGVDWFKKHYLSHIEEYREGVVYTLILDFCFSGETVNLDYWAIGGYLDNGDSCDVETSDKVMPPVDEESEAGYRGKYFHLLEPHHLAHIIQAMEENLEKSEINTIEDVNKIKAMREFCLNNDDYKAAYIYNRI